MELPFSVSALDPHAADDVASLLLSPAIADPLYAWDGTGRPYPALAASLPDPAPEGSRIALRPGLVTSHGRPLDASDVVFSLERAKARGAHPLLAAFGRPRRVPGDARAILVPGASPGALAEALASPTAAIVPRTFVAEAPDGTGAFRATRSDEGFVLERNDAAARGPAFLDRIDVHGSIELASALRAFEAGDADLGFLGAGLHRRRAAAVDFRTPALGFVVLRTGPEAGSWSAPGVAERLVSSMDPARFAHLGLVLGPRGQGDGSWGGAPVDILVDQGSPYLLEVARVVATVLSRPGHELRPAPVSQGDLRRRRGEGRYALAIDVVRLLGPTPHHTLLSLLAAADPRLSERPPNLSPVDTSVVGRMLPLAVLGELVVSGAHAGDVHGLEQWDLGGVFRDAPPGAESPH